MEMRMNLLYLPFLLMVLCTGTFLLSQTRARDGDSRKFQLSPILKVTTSNNPTMDAGRLNINLLMDGKLPDDGWRSTWTAWFKVDPVVTFDLGADKKIGIVRIYFQPTDRADEFAEVKVEVSRDGKQFVDFNEYEGFVSEKGKGAWAEIDLRAVNARYFRLSPRFRGWGHLWGEVEFWEISK
jgi:hypothetical protein